MRVLITGATGFIGHLLTDQLISRGWEVAILSRRPNLARERLSSSLKEAGASLRFYAWDLLKELPPAEALEGVSAVVHLAGEPLAETRWSAEQKEKIRATRVLGTRNLVQAIAAQARRPEVLITSSAIGFYGDRGDEKLDENSSAGTGFLSEVCRDWEREALDAERLGEIRVVRLRTGIVLGLSGGVLPKLLPLFRWGAGGPVGSGRQWMSWIHEQDLVDLICWCLERSRIAGAWNAVAPHPVTNRDFARELGQALRRPAFIPAPATALKFALGEMSELVLQSQRVLPRRALESGFEFRFDELGPALRDLLANHDGEGYR